jgi:conjugal transfer mating pair stabilization protein TraN
MLNLIRNSKKITLPALYLATLAMVVTPAMANTSTTLPQAIGVAGAYFGDEWVFDGSWGNLSPRQAGVLFADDPFPDDESWRFDPSQTEGIQFSSSGTLSPDEEDLFPSLDIDLMKDLFDPDQDGRAAASSGESLGKGSARTFSESEVEVDETTGTVRIDSQGERTVFTSRDLQGAQPGEWSELQNLYQAENESDLANRVNSELSSLNWDDDIRATLYRDIRSTSNRDRSDPRINVTNQDLEASRLVVDQAITDNFGACSTEYVWTDSGQTHRITDQKSCSAMWKPEGQCSVQHDYEVRHQRASVNVSTAFADTVDFTVDFTTGSVSADVASGDSDATPNPGSASGLASPVNSSRICPGGGIRVYSELMLEQTFESGEASASLSILQAPSCSNGLVGRFRLNNATPAEQDRECEEGEGDGGQYCQVDRTMSASIEWLVGTTLRSNWIDSQNPSGESCLRDVSAVVAEFCTDGATFVGADTSGCSMVDGERVCEGSPLASRILPDPPYRGIPRFARQIDLGVPVCDFNVGESCWVDVNGERQCDQGRPGLWNECQAYSEDPALSHCIFERTQCIEGAEDSNGNCFVYEEIWECGDNVRADHQTLRETTVCPGEIRCMGQECINPSQDRSTSFGEVAAYLNAAEHSATDQACEDPNDPSTCLIFDGEAISCKRVIGGIVNCCSETPTQVGLGDYVGGILAVTRMDKQILQMGADGSIYGAWTTVRTPFASAGGAVQGAFNSAQNWFSSVTDSVLGTTETATTGVGATEAIGGFKQQITNKVADWTGQIFGEQARDSLFTQGANGFTLNAGIANALQMISFAYTVYTLVVLIIQIIWKCEEDELSLSAKREMGLCHLVGSYCASDIFGICIERRQSFCCYNSPLSRIIQQQTKTESEWGSAKDPVCEGMTMSELSSIDWDSIDLSEWIGMLSLTDNLPANAQELASSSRFTADGLTGAGSTLDGGERMSAGERNRQRVQQSGIEQAVEQDTRSHWNNPQQGTTNPGRTCPQGQSCRDYDQDYSGQYPPAADLIARCDYTPPQDVDPVEQEDGGKTIYCELDGSYSSSQSTGTTIDTYTFRRNGDVVQQSGFDLYSFTIHEDFANVIESVSLTVVDDFGSDTYSMDINPYELANPYLPPYEPPFPIGDGGNNGGGGPSDLTCGPIDLARDTGTFSYGGSYADGDNIRIGFPSNPQAVWSIDNNKYAAMAFNSGPEGQLARFVTETIPGLNLAGKIVSVTPCEGDFDVTVGSYCRSPRQINGSPQAIPSLSFAVAPEDTVNVPAGHCRLEPNTNYFINVVHGQSEDQTTSTCTEEACQFLGLMRSSGEFDPELPDREPPAGLQRSFLTYSRPGQEYVGDNARSPWFGELGSSMTRSHQLERDHYAAMEFTVTEEHRNWIGEVVLEDSTAAPNAPRMLTISKTPGDFTEYLHWSCRTPRTNDQPAIVSPDLRFEIGGDTDEARCDLEVGETYYINVVQANPANLLDSLCGSEICSFDFKLRGGAQEPPYGDLERSYLTVSQPNGLIADNAELEWIDGSSPMATRNHRLEQNHYAAKEFTVQRSHEGYFGSIRVGDVDGLTQGARIVTISETAGDFRSNIYQGCRSPGLWNAPSRSTLINFSVGRRDTNAIYCNLEVGKTYYLNVANVTPDGLNNVCPSSECGFSTTLQFERDVVACEVPSMPEDGRSDRLIWVGEPGFGNTQQVIIRQDHYAGLAFNPGDNEAARLTFERIGGAIASAASNWEVSVSHCPGNFNVSNPLCRRSGLAQRISLSIGSESGCQVTPGVEHYLNIRATDQNGDSTCNDTECGLIFDARAISQ